MVIRLAISPVCTLARQYIKENNGHMLEADEVATALQAEYRYVSIETTCTLRGVVDHWTISHLCVSLLML